MDLFEIVDERFRRMVLANALLERLADGLRWAEGPVWFGDRGCLLFSDLPNDRILCWSDAAGLSVARSPCGYTNGHARDRQGRLISCSHRERRIERTELDGRITVLASHHAGRRLNSPNDLVCRSDGTIWFSDPVYGISTDYEGGKQVSELPSRLYCLDPRDGRLTVAADDFVNPNGLAFSPDERTLYVTEAGDQFARAPERHIRRYAVDADGRLRDAAVFHTVTPGYSDGLRVDEEGNLWSSAADGVHCIDPSGALLGKVRVPSSVSNVAFGGRALSRLFICASQTLYAVYLNVRGARLV